MVKSKLCGVICIIVMGVIRMAKQKKKIANGKLKKNNIDIIKNVSDLKRESVKIV